MALFRFRMIVLYLCLILANGIAAAQKGKPSPIIYKVDVTAHDFVFAAPTFLPTCAAETRGAYTAWFPDVEGVNDLCAIVTLLPAAPYSEYYLRDSVMFRVNTDASGNIVSLTLRGQDQTGKAGIMHETELIVLSQPVFPSSLGFVIHIDRDNIPVWKLSQHRDGKPVEIVGYISLGDLVYSRKA